MVGDIMKRIGNILVFIIALFISLNFVYADTFTASLSGNDTFEDEIVLDLKIDSLTGFSNGLFGLDTTISYDPSKISLVDITERNYFAVTYDFVESNKIIAYAHYGAIVNNTIYTFTFKNIGLAENESTTISFSNSVASDGDKDIEGTITGKTITLAAPDYVKGDFNGDGEIGLVDVIKLLKVYLGLEGLTDANLAIGDMNNDNQINLVDVIAILKSYLGLN